MVINALRKRAAKKRDLAVLSCYCCKYMSSFAPSVDDVDVRWKTLRDYHRRYGYTRFQREGFHRFMRSLLPSIISERSCVDVVSAKHFMKHSVTFGKLTIYRPTHMEIDGTVQIVYPHEARQRKLTYCNSVCVHIEHVVEEFMHPIDHFKGFARGGAPAPRGTVLAGWLADEVPGGGGTPAEGRDGERNGAPPARQRLLRDATGNTIAVFGCSALFARDSTPAARVFVHGTWRVGVQAFEATRVSSKIDVEADLRLIQRTVHRRLEVPLFNMPTMVNSDYCNLSVMDTVVHPKECTHDEGGYFIINGNEKALMAQNRVQENRLFVFRGKGKHAWHATIRSCHESKWRSTSTLSAYLTEKSSDITLAVPFVWRNSTSLLHIPLAVIYAALGADERVRRRLFELVGPNERAAAMIAHNFKHPLAGAGREEALEWITKRSTHKDKVWSTSGSKWKYLNHIFTNEFLPHVGIEGTPLTLFRKCYFVTVMTCRLIDVANGVSPPSNRDSLKSKKIDGPGELLALLFRQLFRNSLRLCLVQLTRAVESGKYISIMSAMSPFRKLTSQLKYHFATGNWSQQKGVNTGVCQMLSRMSLMALRSQLGRVLTPLNRDGKCTAPRMLSADAWGVLCPSESPEGAACGLVNNLAFMAVASTSFSAHEVEAVIAEEAAAQGLCYVAGFAENVSPERGSVVVFVNGRPTGTAADASIMTQHLRALRRAHVLPYSCSITNTSYGVFLYTTTGRLMRPVFVLENLGRGGRLPVDRSTRNWFTKCFHTGVIEYLDKNEEAFCCVATSYADVQRNGAQGYTHVELDPNVIFGCTVGVIPDANYDQGPRLAYQAAMSKQAITVPSLAARARTNDSHFYMLNHTQKPLTSTRLSRFPGVNLPSGHSCVVAIMTYTGRNQEDSIIMKRSAIERGMFSVAYSQCIRDEIGKRGSEKEVFERPDPNECLGIKGNADYSKIDFDGLPFPGTWLQKGDVVIGKTVTVRQRNPQGEWFERKICRSTVLRNSADGGCVESVGVTLNKDGCKMVWVKTRKSRPIHVGDKFSSRHGPSKCCCGTHLTPANFRYCGTRERLIVASLADSAIRWQAKREQSARFLPKKTCRSRKRASRRTLSSTRRRFRAA